MLRFHSFDTAEKTICGIEIMHMIIKRQFEAIQCVLSEVEFFNNVMGISAYYSTGNTGIIGTF